MLTPLPKSTVGPLLLLTSIAMFSGCDQSPSQEAPVTTSELPPSPNCLIIVLDAFHAEKSSLYGFDQSTTPNLEEWAKRGVIFEDALSQYVSTSGSAWSYLNGKYPYSSFQVYPMRPQDSPLASLFQQQGYRTAGFSDNPFINGTTKVDKGFSHFRYHKYIEQQVESGDGSLSLNRDEISELLFEELFDWVNAKDADPWFAYVHTMRPHNPYASKAPYMNQYVDMSVVPEGEKPENFFHRYEKDIFARLYKEGWSPEIFERFQVLHQLYLSNIAYIDALLGELLENLEKAGQLENTLVVVMSDHGEAFAQHWNFLHARRTPYRELTHIPLVIIPPASWKIEPSRVATSVELVDLLPTLTDAFDLNDPIPRDGQSLLPLMRGDGDYPDKTRYTQSTYELAVIKNQRKLIFKYRDKLDQQGNVVTSLRMMTRLYDLKNDPREQNNLYVDGESGEALMALGQEYLRSQEEGVAGEEPEFTDEEQEIMESLGYID